MNRRRVVAALALAVAACGCRLGSSSHRSSSGHSRAVGPASNRLCHELVGLEVEEARLLAEYTKCAEEGEARHAWVEQPVAFREGEAPDATRVAELERALHDCFEKVHAHYRQAFRADLGADRYDAIWIRCLDFLELCRYQVEEEGRDLYARDPAAWQMAHEHLQTRASAIRRARARLVEPVAQGAPIRLEEDDFKQVLHGLEHALELRGEDHELLLAELRLAQRRALLVPRSDAAAEAERHRDRALDAALDATIDAERLRLEQERDPAGRWPRADGAR